MIAAMAINLKAHLRKCPVARWLFQSTLVTGDNVRLAVQRPALRRALPGRATLALDAGAGSGEYTRSLLLPRAGRTVAVDLDLPHLGRFAGRLRPDEGARCLVAAATLAAIPARDAAFDLVLCTEVLEHCEDDRAVLAELARVTAAGGTLVISVPVPPAPYPDSAHVREGYTEEGLSALLDAAGFRVAACEFCLFRISRALLRFRHRTRSRLPLPLMPLVHLERLLYRRGDQRNRPFDLVIRAIRR